MIADYLPTQRGHSFELKEHQQEALNNLAAMRAKNETIALLYHATGTGKTVTAVSDAKRVGGRVLYIAHTKDLIAQAAETFNNIWPEASVGLYVENQKETDTQIVCGSVQSIALNLESFFPESFDYLIVDEAHHASAETYQKVLAYFKPRFTLGLTATPDRADGTNILEIFKNTAHRLDIQTAVEIGELVPVRCIRIHTNIDLTKVRFNSIQYNIRDLESKIFVPERNRLIVDTWMEYVRDKRTVIFCASRKHAELITGDLMQRGVAAMAVDGSMKLAERNEVTVRFASGKLKVLCACDLLNEGWDCPETEVLFMARPTMSKVLYTQQLGRGMRLCEGKDSLMVFDFVDNASQYNTPYSLHRLFKIGEYHPGKLAVAPTSQRIAEDLLSAHKAELNSTVTEYQLRIERLNRLHQSAIDEVQKNAHAELDAERHRVSQLRHDNAALSKQVESLSKQLAKAKGPVRQVVFVDEKLYICGGTIKCEKYSHDIEEVTGIIDTVRGNPVSMTVCHCKSCKLYYVRDTVFESYREKYGSLLGKFVRQADGMKMGLITAYGELAPESLLHMNGYNVNQTDNLSPGERRKILTYVIESHIMSRYDIRNHLSYLVKMNQYNPSKSIAASRWKSGIQWVNDYHIDKQDTVWLSGTAMYKHWHKS